jgi:SAM-dependent methyltransferase
MLFLCYFEMIDEVFRKYKNEEKTLLPIRMINMKCKICYNAEANKMYKVKEMMFGYRDEFIYFQCSKCGCLQILEIPRDMSKYYPSNYYSFLLPRPNKSRYSIKRFIRKRRDSYAVFGKGAIGKLVYTIFPDDNLRMLSRVHPKKTLSTLDVGCGSGSLLYILREIGFEHLLGIDPYIKENIEYENGLKIIKKSIHDVDGKWDLIMFHHSFEHIPDPADSIQSVSKILTKGGVCLIRIPIVASYAWEHYKVNWVQLDAPRHFFLHSVKSIDILAEKANLNLEEIIYEATDFQFWGSEQYIKDIPLTSPYSYYVNPSKSIFKKEQIKLFRKKAEELNSMNQGDSAAFILRKK